jgi:CheY-like chemotaxis protein
MERDVVLVVDDDPLVRELLAEILSDHGYDVIEAKNGQEALQLASERSSVRPRLCLVLLDMMLPGIDGTVVLNNLERASFDVPVVAISASQIQLARAARNGARDTIAKPFDADHLLDTVDRHRLPRA